MEINPIKNDKDYQCSLKRLELIFDAEPNSAQGEEAEILSLLIDNYENEHYAIEAPDPIEAIKIRMEELNLKQKDLADIIGEKGKVSEVLNRKRRLSLTMIRKIHEKLQLPPALLIKEYKLA